MAGPIRLGVAPIAWSNNDLPQLGGDTTPRDLPDARARKAGFSGTETGVKFPMDAEGPRADPREAQAGAGLRLVLRRAPEALGQGRAGAHRWRRSRPSRRSAPRSWSMPRPPAPCRTRSTAPLSKRPRLAEADFPAYGRKLTELAEWMADYGVADDLSPSHGHGRSRPQREIDLLMANTGTAVGLLVDTGHLTFAGGDIVATTRRHGRRINHVHCKDLRPDVLEGRAPEGPELPRRRARRRLHRAGRRLHRLPRLRPRCSSTSATRAGWWSRPSRIRPRRRPRIFAHGPPPSDGRIRGGGYGSANSE